MRTASLACCLILLALQFCSESQAEPAINWQGVEAFLKVHCQDCHGAEEPEGDLSLGALRGKKPTEVSVWRRVYTQLATGEMPPDGEPRPDLAQREAVLAWIESTLAQSGATAPSIGGPLPADGNLIDHDRLFSGRVAGPISSPPRFWRRSQPQYDALMERLWVIPKLRYEKSHTRSNPDWAAFSYSQPFPAMDPHHFTDYAGGVHADEAVLRALMDAGGQIAERLTSDQTAYAKQLQPPVAVGIPSIRRGSPWEKFKQEPPPRPLEFEPFLGKDASPTQQQNNGAVRRCFLIFLNRPPNTEESQRYGSLLQQSTKKSGPKAALQGLITAMMVSPEFVLRMELGRGPVDAQGRRMLSPEELVYAISYALTDEGPDETLRAAARSGKLNSRKDVEREVRRLLSDETIEKHRPLRFFQEFFGYHRAVDVFKDKPGWKIEAPYLIRDADMLVEYVLKKDRQVFAELLTTDRYFVAYPHIKDPQLFAAIIANTLEETQAALKKSKARGRKIEPGRNGRYNRLWSYTQGRALIPRTVHNDRGSAEMSYISIYGFDAEFEWTADQPIEVPGRRAGLLTHPAWLVAHSTNFENDIVRRGHWIREHLLAGKIPDVPIDVEAKVPGEPDQTLRHRMRVTQESRCIRCHRRMDPLGFPFEIYDHYGRYREEEMVGVRDNVPRAIDPTGAILASGESSLDGPVDDAIDLVHRLAKSERVRQSIVRHAFRYWMARNERLSDAPVLIAADNAYATHDGSFNELLVSLLTSDAFLYRK